MGTANKDARRLHHNALFRRGRRIPCVRLRGIDHARTLAVVEEILRLAA
jgi:hypothetical protein